MWSTLVNVCVPCRYAKRSDRWRNAATCERCGEPMKQMGNWAPPAHNNVRAWKRIERGEWLWDRRRRRRGMNRYNKTVIKKPNLKKGQGGYLIDYNHRDGLVDLGG